MRPYTSDIDPVKWRQEYATWQAQHHAAQLAQQQAHARLDAAEQRLSTLNTWAGTLAALATAAAQQAGTDAALSAMLASLAQGLDQNSGLQQDRRAARELATSRALAAPPLSEPLVLLPLRLQTKWAGTTLTVRIYPGDLHVDRHDPRLTAEEQDLAATYWATKNAPGAQQDSQAWQDLARKAGGPRAAWIVTATAPGARPPGPRDSPWDLTVTARLLPDRFAVIAYQAGEPVNLTPPGQPARYTAWGAPIPDPLPLSTLHQAGEQPWTSDLTAALAAGMAIQINLPAPPPAIDQLVVVGLRTRGGALADLIDSHTFSSGVEVLADRTPTNNSSQIRAAHAPRRDEEIAAALIDPHRPAGCTDGTAGAQLADLLGLPRARIAAIAGATAGRAAVAQAMSAIVQAAGVSGPVGAQASAAWPLVSPGGPAPAVRAGRQPYGVLPATAPARWLAASGELTAPLAPLLSAWAARHTARFDIDPDSPPPTLGRPSRDPHRRVGAAHPAARVAFVTDLERRPSQLQRAGRAGRSARRPPRGRPVPGGWRRPPVPRPRRRACWRRSCAPPGRATASTRRSPPTCRHWPAKPRSPVAGRTWRDCSPGTWTPSPTASTPGSPRRPPSVCSISEERPRQPARSSAPTAT